MREQADSDCASMACGTLPSVAINTGTVTHTRIRSEQSDTDYASTARTLPAHIMMGTATKTLVKMEVDDQDPRRHSLTVLSRCSS